MDFSRNHKLSHHLLPFQQAVLPTDYVFLRRVQEAHPEALSVTADELTPTPPEHSLCSWSVLSLQSQVAMRSKEEEVKENNRPTR